VTAEECDPKTTLLADVMTPNPRTIGADKPLGHALHMMYEGGFRNVPVVENGRPIGMVSAHHALGPELKQFVSEMDQRENIAEILSAEGKPQPMARLRDGKAERERVAG
jgi:signal-transduction protein with cAMP-binding, CBS, and nucleotidyltransferase domain